jgi:hypothetical protein
MGVVSNDYNAFNIINITFFKNAFELYPPLGNFSITFFLAITFAHRFLRKKLNGRSNFFDQNNFEKIDTKSINLPFYYHMAISNDKINRKGDSET